MREQASMTAQRIMSADEVEWDRDRWQYVRAGGVTASEIASVIGIAPGTNSSAFELFHTKQMGREFQPDNEAMAWGRFAEPYIADRFAAEHTNLAILPGGLYRSPARPWQMCTFDRLAIDRDVLDLRGVDYERILNAHDTCGFSSAMPVQIKTSATTDGWGEPGSRDMPAHYLAQVVYEMDVQDADTAWVPVMFPPQRITTYVVRRDADIEADMALMRELAEWFLELLRTDTPPPIDSSPATTRALKAIHPDMRDAAVQIPQALAKRYRRARLAKITATARLRQAENEIRARMGDATRAVTVDPGGGTNVIAVRRQFPRSYIDAERLRQKLPKVASEYRKTSPVDALYPGEWAK